jgi:hypothetical protein
MKKIFGTLCLSASLLMVASAVSAQDVETPTYSNARIVSVDPALRLVVLSVGGVRESLTLDDLMPGTGSFKAGDFVIVTVRGGPGRKRISAMTLAPPRTPVAASPNPPVQTSQSPRPPLRTEQERREARIGYAARVAALSRQAASVDGLWSSFVAGCAVKPVSNDGGGREWFGLWDGRVFADYSGGQCRDLFNQLVTNGEVIKSAMIGIEQNIEDWLTPGEIREIRRSHSMNWDGWTLPAPPRRDP